MVISVRACDVSHLQLEQLLCLCAAPAVTSIECALQLCQEPSDEHDRKGVLYSGATSHRTRRHGIGAVGHTPSTKWIPSNPACLPIRQAICGPGHIPMIDPGPPFPNSIATFFGPRVEGFRAPAHPGELALPLALLTSEVITRGLQARCLLQRLVALSPQPRNLGSVGCMRR